MKQRHLRKEESRLDEVGALFADKGLLFDDRTPSPDSVRRQLISTTASTKLDMATATSTVIQRASDAVPENAVFDSESRVIDPYTDPYIAQVAAEVYALIVKAWKLDDSDAERLLDVNHQTWMLIKKGKWSELFDQEHLMRISAIVGLYEALHSCFNNNFLANRWVKRPNTEWEFSGRKPIDVMIEGGLPVIIETRDYMGALLGIE